MTSSSDKISMYNSICKAAAKIDENIKVIPADTKENILSKYMIDEFKVMPETKDSNLKEIVEFLLDNHIINIFPSRDGELKFWSRHKEELNALNINVVVSPLNSVQICLDKLKFYHFGKQKKLPFINTFTDIDTMVKNNKYVVKDRFGSGSNNTILDITKYRAINAVKYFPQFIIQPFVEGKEFSVDAWLDKNYVLKAFIMRYRNLIKHGESRVSTTFRNEQVEKEIIQIISHFKLNGPIVIQAIIDKNGRLNIIEINPRFGGASALSIEAGLDSIFWSLCESCGYDIDELPFKRSEKEVRQIRAPKDNYLYDYNF